MEICVFIKYNLQKRVSGEISLKCDTLSSKKNVVVDVFCRLPGLSYTVVGLSWLATFHEHSLLFSVILMTLDENVFFLMKLPSS